MVEDFESMTWNIMRNVFKEYAANTNLLFDLINAVQSIQWVSFSYASEYTTNSTYMTIISHFHHQ